MRLNRISAIMIGIAFCFSTLIYADEVALFNGKDLSGWTLDTRVKNNGKKITKEDVFLVQNGVLICRGGLSIGSLRHEGTFESDYELSLEWRWGPNIASGADISIHAEDEGDEFGRRKEILVHLASTRPAGSSIEEHPVSIRHVIVRPMLTWKRTWASGISYESSAVKK